MSFLYLRSNTPQSLHYIAVTLAKRKKEKKEEETSILITRFCTLSVSNQFYAGRHTTSFQRVYFQNGNLSGRNLRDLRSPYERKTADTEVERALLLLDSSSWQNGTDITKCLRSAERLCIRGNKSCHERMRTRNLFLTENKI